MVGLADGTGYYLAPDGALIIAMFLFADTKGLASMVRRLG